MAARKLASFCCATYNIFQSTVESSSSQTECFLSRIHSDSCSMRLYKSSRILYEIVATVRLSIIQPLAEPCPAVSAPRGGPKRGPT
eukprot:COSAG06_NODE_10853_length_1607_cov_1.555703_2_plen_85_part_01